MDVTNPEELFSAGTDTGPYDASAVPFPLLDEPPMSASEPMYSEDDQAIMDEFMRADKKFKKRKAFVADLLNREAKQQVDSWPEHELRKLSELKLYNRRKARTTRFILSKTDVPICATIDWVINWLSPIYATAPKQPVIQALLAIALNSILRADSIARRVLYATTDSAKGPLISELVVYLDDFHGAIIKLATCMKTNGNYVVNEHRLSLLAPQWAKLTTSTMRWLEKYADRSKPA